MKWYTGVSKCALVNTEPTRKSDTPPLPLPPRPSLSHIEPWLAGQAGVVTNLLAGIAGAKWGIKWTLLVGLTLQLAGLGMLFGWRDDWCAERALKVR